MEERMQEEKKGSEIFKTLLKTRWTLNDRLDSNIH